MPIDAPTLLVLAAGAGRRYGGLKQFDPIGPNGETLLDYSVFDALRAGFGRVVFVIRGDFATVFKARVGRRYRDRIRVDHVCQDLFDLPAGFGLPSGRVRPWGTLHAARAARHVVDAPFALINADDFYGPRAYLDFVSDFGRPQRAGANVDHYCMLGYPLRQTLSTHGGVNRAICVEAGEYLTGVEECTGIVPGTPGFCRGIDARGNCVTIPENAVASMNFWGFTPSVFGQMERYFSAFLKAGGQDANAECHIPGMVDELIRCGEADCRILKTDSEWFGITYAQDKPDCIAAIRTLIDSGVYEKNLWG